MQYLKNSKRKTLDGGELRFVRCDRDGNIIPAESLQNLSITNSTIERIVGGVSRRLSSHGEDGAITG